MHKRPAFPVFILLIIILSAALFFYFDNSGQNFAPQGKTHEIVLTEDGFMPAEITIKTGDSVKFSTTTRELFWPASDLHPTHGIYPEFDPQEPVDPESNWTFRFLKSGKWKFHDHLSPFHRGTVTVAP